MNLYEILAGLGDTIGQNTANTITNPQSAFNNYMSNYEKVLYPDGYSPDMTMQQLAAAMKTPKVMDPQYVDNLLSVMPVVGGMLNAPEYMALSKGATLQAGPSTVRVITPPTSANGMTRVYNVFDPSKSFDLKRHEIDKVILDSMK